MRIDMGTMFGDNGRVFRDTTSPQILLSGGWGSGKSYALCCKLIFNCLSFPGYQAIIARKFRANLSNTIIPLLDSLYYRIFPDKKRIVASSRQRYEFPNGSQITIFGLDSTISFFGGSYHGAFISEVVEMEEEAVEDLASRLRLPTTSLFHRQLLMDTNPAGPNHWLLNWVADERVVHYTSTYKDNPAVDQAYVDQLNKLTGYRRSRMVEGLWVAAEGLIFENYEKALTDIDYVYDEGLKVAGCDFGWTDSSAVVFGVFKNDKLVITDVIKEKGKKVEALLKDEHKDYLFVCDSSRPDSIADLKQAGFNAIPCTKGAGSILRGINVIGQGIDTGKIKIGKRCKPLIDEIQSYQWDPKNDEKPLDGQEDHAIDAFRYLADYLSTVYEVKAQSSPPRQIAMPVNFGVSSYG